MRAGPEGSRVSLGHRLGPGSSAWEARCALLVGLLDEAANRARLRTYGPAWKRHGSPRPGRCAFSAAGGAGRRQQHLSCNSRATSHPEARWPDLRDHAPRAGGQRPSLPGLLWDRGAWRAALTLLDAEEPAGCWKPSAICSVTPVCGQDPTSLMVTAAAAGTPGALQEGRQLVRDGLDQFRPGPGRPAQRRAFGDPECPLLLR